MSSNEWQRLRAGFAVQGPYRRRNSRRVMRWLVAFAIVGAVIAVSL